GMTMLSSNCRRLPGREREDGTGLVRFTRTQHNGREIRLIRRIREVFRFKTKSVALVVRPSAFTDLGAVEKVPCIQLNAWLSGMQFQHPPGSRFVHGGPQLQRSRLSIQYPAMIVASSVHDLRMIVIDPGTNPRGCTKIKWCIRNFGKASFWYQLL